MRNTPSEGKLDKRITAVGVIGFLGLSGVFFLLGLFCIGPMVKSQMRSRAQTPHTVYNPPAHPQTQDTTEPQAKDQQQLDIEITEQASEETPTEDQGLTGDEGVSPENNTITFTLEPEDNSKPAPKPAEPDKPKKASVSKETVPMEKPRVTTESPRSAPSTDRIYRVRAGTFASRTNAETLRDDLKARGYHPEIRSVQTQGRVLYRVQLGGYRTQEDANELSKDLSDEGYTPTTFTEKAD